MASPEFIKIPLKTLSPERELDSQFFVSDSEDKIGFYRATKLLGTGSFSRVKLGYDTRKESKIGLNHGSQSDGKLHVQDLVAIKMIDKKILKGSEILRMSVGREVEVMRVRRIFFFFSFSLRRVWGGFLLDYGSNDSYEMLG